MRSNQSKRLLILGCLIFTLILVYISTVWLVPTLSRYIFREEDEIRAHYSALYFASTGEGKTIALENGTGYIDFDLRNYIGENVTERDIVYTISTPTKFYDKDENEIDNVETYLAASPTNELHVLDVWGEAQKIAKSTYLYDVEIVKNSGEVVSEGVYRFSYEKLGASAVGKVHSVTCKVTRKDGLDPGNDTISLVVQLSKPYKEVLIINMNISNLLITFAHKEVTMFDVDFDKLYIQTADLFGYHKDEYSTPRTIPINDNSYFRYNSYAFKVTITWNGYVLDEDKLNEIHIGTSLYPGSDKLDDKSDSNGIANNVGTTPNPDIDKPYLDVSRSTIAKINSSYDNTNGHSGELVMFVPQSSDIYLMFLKTASSGSIDVKVEVYISYYKRNNLNEDFYLYNSAYRLYNDTDFGAYVHTDNKFNITSY